MKQFSSRHRKLVFTILASALLLISAACSHQPTDAQIIGNIVTRIQGNPQISKKEIAVMSQGGVVTLRGTVPTDAERSAAATDAAQVPGVRSVINDIFIDGPATTEAQQASVTEPEPTQPEVSAVRSAPAKQRNNKPSAYATREISEPAVNAQATKPAAAASTNSNLPIVVENASAVQSPAATIPALPSIPGTPAVKPVQLVRVESGTSLSVRLTDSIDSDRNQPGDSFRGTLDSPVYVDGQQVIPAGTHVLGRVSEVQDSGRFSGRPQIAIELTSLSVNGRSYSIQTNQYTKQGNSQGSRTAKTVGGGAALGALIGAIAGGGKGAAIGAAVGAGAGGGVQAARGRQQVHLGSEARLNFRLESPISVNPVSTIDRDSNSNYQSNASIFNQDQQSSNNSYQTDEPVAVDPPDGDRPVLKRRPAPSNPPN